MFRKILKKDFRRKKAMNIILFVFLLTASVLLAGSSNLLYSTVAATDYFMDISKVADVIAVMFADEAITEKIKDWSESSSLVSDAYQEDAVILDQELILTDQGKVLRNTNGLMVMKKPEKYNLVFDTEGKDFEVGPSEAAIPVSVQLNMGLSLGDWITIGIDGYQQEFTIKHIFKDAVFGAEMMGMKRIILNESDFSKYMSNSTVQNRLKFWHLSKTEGYTNNDLMNDFADLILPTQALMSRDLISTAYILDLILAAIMIIVSIFLILISFFILRFTIVFTVMEDYKQIGVMKAIGLKNKNIRGMYTVKYLTLALVSGVIGYFISIPVSDLMKRNISQYIILKDSVINYVVAFASVAAVIGITILFCNYSTGKIKKISAIDAIRQGSSGERFKNTKKIKLHKRKKVNIPLFLACSDILSDFKKFFILMITFLLGTAIIIIPNNVISTLSSDETIEFFGYIQNDFYIRNELIGNQQVARDRIEELSRSFEEKGFKTELVADMISNGKLYNRDKSKSIGILGFQGVGTNQSEYDYVEGMVPELKNEIAITEKAAEYIGVTIGDTVICEVQGITKEYIVTALFQTFNNLGNGVRMVEDYEAENGGSTSITVSGKLNGTPEEKKEQLQRMKKEFPELEIKVSIEVVNSFIGSVTSQLGAVKNLILLLVMGINFLITSLLLRMLISKEIPEIAILKSLGFHSHSIKLWQIFRIGILLAVSIFAGTIIANSTGELMSAGIFRIMGVTRLKLIIEPLQVYLVYPVLLFIVTMIAVILNVGQIRRTHVWELNNQE